MSCYNCRQPRTLRTEYPKIDGIQYVRRVCTTCGHKTHPIEVVKI